MDEDFLRAVEFTLKWEGYKSDDPHDPGGLTIWGLASRYHPEVKVWAGLPPEESKERAKEVYYHRYWKRFGEGLPWPLCLFVFDTAVQFWDEAARMLQQLANKYLVDRELKVDGVIGPKTQEAVAELMHTHYYPMCYGYLVRRIAAHASNPNFKFFGRGWIRRVIELAEFI